MKLMQPINDALEQRHASYPRVRICHDFDTSYLGHEPIVFTNLMKSWPAYGKWSLTNLQNEFGETLITADRYEGDHSKYIQIRLDEYIDYMREAEEANPFYGKTALHLYNTMRSEYDASSFPCWYRQWYLDHPDEERKLLLSSLFLGPVHASSRLHIDMWGTSFWNALFEGRKLWLFFDPADESYLYGGRVSPFTPELDRFPDYVKALPRVHVQQPGELIYCPGRIWHAVYVLEPSLALSENFINNENYHYVINHFREEGHQRALRKMEQMVAAYAPRGNAILN